MAQPKLGSFFNWSDEDLNELSSVSELDLEEALALADETEGEVSQFLRATVDKDREIFFQGADDDASPNPVETGA